ncbi:Histidinol-phosphatase [Mycena chlorophos]|uniref:Histidinol-phosphatase n=1 Tax=Mycena chlorophos TaxID=658473 RepID=A0A8H6S1M7_MYCCL|nr:Histidinol-phosphatase [Mycena chlorophos]
MPWSHHSHSGQFCKHAVGSLADVVKEAIRKGFEVYGLTEHAPRYRTEDLGTQKRPASLPTTLLRNFDAFLDEAHRLKKLYVSQIRLLRHFGRIEYLVGSVHHVNGTPIDFSTRPRSAKPRRKQARPTLSSLHISEAQYEMLQRLRPEIVGHFDLCRLYTPGLQFANYPDALKLAQRNIMVRHWLRRPLRGQRSRVCARIGTLRIQDPIFWRQAPVVGS